MSKKIVLGLWLFLGVLSVAGCATSGRNYQTDIDAQNAKIAALQGQLSSKDDEIQRLQNDADSQSSALADAENERRLLNQKMDALSEELQAAKSRPVVEAQKAEESDLK